MPRVKPRTSIYGVLPILGCLIMVLGIAATIKWGIMPYRAPYAAKEGLPPIREFPEPEAPKPVVVDTTLPKETTEPKEQPKEEAAPAGKEAPPGETVEPKKEDAKGTTDEKAPPAPKEETKEPKKE